MSRLNTLIFGGVAVTASVILARSKLMTSVTEHIEPPIVQQQFPRVDDDYWEFYKDLGEDYNVSIEQFQEKGARKRYILLESWKTGAFPYVIGGYGFGQERLEAMSIRRSNAPSDNWSVLKYNETQKKWEFVQGTNSETSNLSQETLTKMEDLLRGAVRDVLRHDCLVEKIENNRFSQNIGKARRAFLKGIFPNY